MRQTMKTIRALRLDQGWTQFELALRVGVQPQAVYLWESGRRVPQVPQMRKLGELFGICSRATALATTRSASGRSVAAVAFSPLVLPLVLFFVVPIRGTPRAYGSFVQHTYRSLDRAP
jgi:transcriptional regulator with XRE-family HTH domain